MLTTPQIKIYIQALCVADENSDEDFHRLVNFAVTSNIVAEIDLSRSFDMSRPAAKRWINGVTAPFPRMRKYVYDFLIRQSIKMI